MTLHPSRTDPMPADANTLDATPSLIQWCQGHQRHVKTAMWLSSVFGTAMLEKPDPEALRAFLIDLSTHGPPEYFELAVMMIENIPPFIATRIERQGYRGAVDWLRCEMETKRIEEIPS